MNGSSIQTLKSIARRIATTSSYSYIAIQHNDHTERVPWPGAYTVSNKHPALEKGPATRD